MIFINQKNMKKLLLLFLIVVSLMGSAAMPLEVIPAIAENLVILRYYDNEAEAINAYGTGWRYYNIAPCIVGVDILDTFSPIIMDFNHSK